MQKLANAIATSELGSDFGTGNQMNPMLKMKYVGDITLGGAEAALGIFTGAKILAAVSTEGFGGK